MSRGRWWVVVGLLLLGTLACDQTSKRIAAQAFTGTVPLYYAGGLIELLYSENAGAFLGLGSKFHETTRFWLFTVGVTVLLLVFGMKLLRARGQAEVVGWTLIVAGGLGNLIDRLLHEGRVIDFLRVGLGGIRTGIFNVADVAIVAGLVALFWASLSSRLDELA